MHVRATNCTLLRILARQCALDGSRSLQSKIVAPYLRAHALGSAQNKGYAGAWEDISSTAVTAAAGVEVAVAVAAKQQQQ